MFLVLPKFLFKNIDRLYELDFKVIKFTLTSAIF